jgi:hypothetical protein
VQGAVKEASAPSDDTVPTRGDNPAQPARIDAVPDREPTHDRVAAGWCIVTVARTGHGPLDRCRNRSMITTAPCATGRLSPMTA